MCYLPTPRLLVLACFAFFGQQLAAQQTMAREWNEAVLQTVREDLARPQVWARNLFHSSVALYDAWAAYDDEATTYLLGKTATDKQTKGYRARWAIGIALVDKFQTTHYKNSNND